MPILRRADRRGITLRLWLLLTTAFVIATVGGGFAMCQASASRTLAGARMEATRTGRLLAWMVANSPGRDTSLVLEEARSALPGVVKVQRLSPDRLVDAWDPILAQQALDHRSEVVSPNFYKQEDGTYLRVYVPSLDRTGKPTVIGAEIDETGAMEGVAAIYGLGLVGLLLACVVGGLFSLSLTRHLIRSAAERRLWKMLQSQRYVKSVVVELVLGGVAATVLVGGGLSLAHVRQLRFERFYLMAEHDRLDGIRNRASEVPISGLSEFARRNGIPGTFQSPQDLVSVVSAKQSELKIAETRNQDDLLSNWFTIAFALGFSALLTLASLWLAHSTLERENDLEQARSDVARSEAANVQIVENLPIGFYTYTQGHIGYCNDAWKGLVHQNEHEEAIEAFEKALHPDEREVVLNALADAVASGSGFGFGHRLMNPNGEIRHVESRGVPIFDETGKLEHVVGFTLDVTTRVRTRQLLESKTSEVEATNARLRQALSDLEDNFEAMVMALVKAVEAKDPYTAGHSERVMEYAVRIGESLGLSPFEIRVLRMGSLIHDIGKIGIPDQVLTKPAPLSPEEYEVVKSHALVGARMVEGIPTFRDCVPIVLLHHERLNGSGYPYGMRAVEIPLLVRIVSVADCFDAMTSTRAYRLGLTPANAIAQLREDAAKGALDSRIVETMAQVIAQSGTLLDAPAAEEAA